jgi:DNA (cytosine-5)-methyltransferase 1
MNRSYYEFFAGGGMARLGLGARWECIFANDIDPRKVETYRANFGGDHVLCEDVNTLTAESLPGNPMLAWASFPCQDLSLAGKREGLEGARSGTFWGFWSAINKLKATNRKPQLLVLENVCGLLTSQNGEDFFEVCRAVSCLGYRFGAVIVDAIHFLPQSRPRLFIVCIDDGAKVADELVSSRPIEPWHNQKLSDAVRNLPADLNGRWLWWHLPNPSRKPPELSSLIEPQGGHLAWHSTSETAQLISLMSPLNRAKLEEVKRKNRVSIGTVYKRTRVEGGKRFQRAEVRFDGVAGCLRTPGGGSSRQTLIVVDGKTVRSRLLSIREAARLMGVPDSYCVPSNYNEGYHVFGDGLAVPAVDHLARSLLDPLAETLLDVPALRRKLAA